MTTRRKKAATEEVKEETTAVAVTGDKGAPALPDYLADFNGRTGAEDIGMDDVTVPRIALGQGTSPQVKDPSSDIEDGDIFVNLGDMLLAKKEEKLDFVLIADPTTEYMLWKDRKDNGGGLLARAPAIKQPDGSIVHVWDKPNAKFENKIEGKVKVVWETGITVEEDGLGNRGSANPDDPEDNYEAATLHRNFLVYLPKFGMIAAFSLAKTWGSPAAKDLKGLIKFGIMKGMPPRKVPLPARVFTCYAYHKTSKNDANATYTTMKVAEHNKPGEWTTDFGLAKAELYAVTSSLYAQYTKSGFVVDQSDEDSGDAGDDGKF